MTVEAMTAADVMSRVLVTVKPDESPLMAWELMRRGSMHHLPVVDSGSHIIGVLTREDIAAHWSGGPAEQSSAQVRQLLGGRRCPHVPPDEPLPGVAAAMLESEVDVVPVIGASGMLKGIVTVTDLLAAVAGRRVVVAQDADSSAGLFRLEPVLPPKPSRAD
ncbi:HPP family protein [Microbispora triticiradicis]|uniref:CBS domain-containing protein n=1 Tax=Microbispora triticiradicis TaxID=2200763 RepID=UPI001AD6D457|nr:CBS domain-containing protein [Microbispora triticiradicis]MBO4275525.1 CBS domain-containing protein [Microbispora triticiradicis]